MKQWKNRRQNRMKSLSLNSYTLKWIAIITMVIDHTGAILLPQFPVMRLIGRISFPIFCFLLVEGFYHTSNIKRYLIRLGIFAFISEIPFDLMFIPTNDYLTHQNVFFTLFIGLATIYGISKADEKWKDNSFISTLARIVVVVVGGILAYLLQTDYGILGIGYIVIFYVFRGRLTLIAILMAVLNYAAYGSLNAQTFAILAIPIIALYNGQKGRSMKYLFYAFYPVHIVILCTIWYLINGL